MARFKFFLHDEFFLSMYIPTFSGDIFKENTIWILKFSTYWFNEYVSFCQIFSAFGQKTSLFLQKSQKFKYILKRRQCKICLFETSFAYSELVVSTIVLTMRTGLTMDKYCNKKLHVVALITRRLKPMFFEMFSSLIPRPLRKCFIRKIFKNVEFSLWPNSPAP